LIPKYILDELAGEDLTSLIEIRDYLDRLIRDREESPEGSEKYRIESKHFDEALKKVLPSKKERDVYSKFAEFA